MLNAMQCTFFIFFLPSYFFHTFFAKKIIILSLQLFLLNGFTSFQTFGKTYAAEEEAKRFEIFKVRTVSLRCNTVVLPKPVELIIKCAQKLNFVSVTARLLPPPAADPYGVAVTLAMPSLFTRVMPNFSGIQALKVSMLFTFSWQFN